MGYTSSLSPSTSVLLRSKTPPPPRRLDDYNYNGGSGGYGGGIGGVGGNTNNRGEYEYHQKTSVRFLKT